MNIQKSPIRLLRPDNQVELLNVIDQLRSGLLSQHVPLPEIVVCGDTSCGKSSVLEALSGVEFPVGSSVCTQFPTELVMERHTEKKASYSIRAGPERSEEVVRRLAAFRGDLDSLTSVPDIINRAKEAMGIENGGAIASDVLRLEILGPDLPHLTLIDLPGLIHNSTSGSEVAQVENLVKRYMKRGRSIILVVVSVRSNIRSQAILTLAKKCDPKGERSIGLITKPDLLGTESDAGEQREFLDLARNQNPEFNFGRQWHVLRNRGSLEPRETLDRATAEQDIFCKAPWNDLLSTQLGLESLRKSLCNTLLEHIRLELPHVVTDIGNEIAKTNKRISDLGIVRATTDEQRRYLLQISRKYEQLVQAALSGQYLDENFFKSPASRLRAQIRDLTDAFELAMRKRGHTHEIKDSATVFSASLFKPAAGQPQLIGKTYMLAKVQKVLNEHRGSELPGMFNPLLVGRLFKEESIQWRNIATQYANDVCSATRAFLKELIDFITPSNTTTSESILHDIFDVAMHERRQTINKKTTELLSPYVEALPFSTQRRLVASLKLIEDEEKNEELVSPDFTAASNLLKWSRAYYNVALENFVDNMATLAVENCVLKTLPELFSSETIVGFDYLKLQRIGGETQEITSQRHYENQKLRILQKSLDLCREYVNVEFETPEESHKGLARELKVVSLKVPHEATAGTSNPNFPPIFAMSTSSAQKTLPNESSDQAPASTDSQFSGIFALSRTTTSAKTVQSSATASVKPTTSATGSLFTPSTQIPPAGSTLSPSSFAKPPTTPTAFVWQTPTSMPDKENSGTSSK